MSQLIKNWGDLNKLLNTQVAKRVKPVIQYTAEDIEQMIIDYVMKEFYSYKPVDYQRTYEYINSLIHTKPIKINNGWRVEIYFDTDRIHASFVEDSNWNQHMSCYGKDVSEEIPGYIEYGTPNNPYYQHEGIHTMEYAKSQTAFIKKKIIGYLKKNGIDTQ